MSVTAAFEPFASIDAAFRAQVSENGDRAALIFEGETRSFAHLGGDVERVSAWLISEGLAPGDRIAWWGKNHPDFVTLMLACARSGVVLVVVNWRLAQREVETILADATPAQLFITEEFTASAPPGAIIAGMPVAALVPAEPVVWKEVDPARPFLQLYTSGTTGVPKGVPQTQSNHLAAYHAYAHSGFGIWSPADRCLISLPVFHAIGANFCLYSLLQGATVHMLREFSIDATRSALATGAITRMPLVPTIIDMLTLDDAIVAMDHTALQTIIYGGSAIPLSVLSRAIAVFGCEFAQCYAATETTAAATCLTPADHLGDDPPLRSCGRPMAGIELRIIDEAGQPVAAGETGEVALRGASVMAGYWNRPEQTASVLQDGWYLTGDAAHQDLSGLVTIVDRTKDMMISGGENVYPSEVESALREHPAVADVGVIGAPDERWGHRITAAIVLAAETPAINLDTIRTFLTPRIARYKHPKQLLLVNALPRNPTGKLLRQPLVDLAVSEWQSDREAETVPSPTTAAF
jgi:acyl-CoA synthetase (AMP-forming)/AMP-acid ligase II